jgi:hypothetical protein
VGQDGGSIGGDEPLVLSHSDEEGRSLPGGDQNVGLFGADHRDAVGAVDFSQRLGYGFFDVAVVALANQVGEHFGIGFGLEGVTALLEHPADGA